MSTDVSTMNKMSSKLLSQHPSSIKGSLKKSGKKNMHQKTVMIKENTLKRYGPEQSHQFKPIAEESKSNEALIVHVEDTEPEV
jgi:hypothetical protein